GALRRSGIPGHPTRRGLRRRAAVAQHGTQSSTYDVSRASRLSDIVNGPFEFVTVKKNDSVAAHGHETVTHVMFPLRPGGGAETRRLCKASQLGSNPSRASNFRRGRCRASAPFSFSGTDDLFPKTGAGFGDHALIGGMPSRILTPGGRAVAPVSQRQAFCRN